MRGLTDLLAQRLHEITLNHASWEEAAVIDRAAAITVLGDRDAGTREPVVRGAQRAEPRARGRDPGHWR